MVLGLGLWSSKLPLRPIPDKAGWGEGMGLEIGDSDRGLSQNRRNARADLDAKRRQDNTLKNEAHGLEDAESGKLGTRIGTWNEWTQPKRGNLEEARMPGQNSAAVPEHGASTDRKRQ